MSINKKLITLQQKIIDLAEELKAQCSEQKPLFSPDQPLRIFLVASHETSVMRYCSLGLARAFEQLGCAVRFIIEQSELERLTLDHKLAQHAQFNPHVVVHINHQYNDGLHPDLFNITWWQDAMPDLIEGRLSPWRRRDLVYSAYGCYDPYLKKSGADDIRRQPFCVDTTQFQNMTPHAPREARNKLIFVGNAHHKYLKGSAWEEKALEAIKPRFLNGEDIPEAFLEELAAALGVTAMDLINGPLNYLVRDTAVAWFCEQHGNNGLEVEIYGRFWEDNPVVAPYFKGEVPHGPELATIYNRARYVLSPLSVGIRSQRLFEAAACGAIPLVYDARPHETDFEWMDHILLFRTPDDLMQRLGETPAKDPLKMVQANSYTAFAQKILNRINDTLGWPQTVSQTETHTMECTTAR